jgi:hypothetical protein
MAAFGGFFVGLMPTPIRRKPSEPAGIVNGRPPPPDCIFKLARALARMLAREDHERKNAVGEAQPK